MLLSALYVNGMPRSGTTLLMHLLSVHPCLAIHKKYPFETRYAVWAWHLYRVLSRPLDELNDNIHWGFQYNYEMVNRNPFGCYDNLLGQYFKEKGPLVLSECCAKMVDDFYLYVAALDSKQLPGYFVEKFPGDIRGTLLEVYSNYREILIWRDPADICKSMVDFNIRRGRLDFGQEAYGNDIDSFCAFVVDWQKKIFESKEISDNPDKFFIARYEDLTDNPIQVVSEIARWVGIDWSDEISTDVEMAYQSSTLSIDSIHRR